VLALPGWAKCTDFSVCLKDSAKLVFALPPKFPVTVSDKAESLNKLSDLIGLGVDFRTFGRHKNEDTRETVTAREIRSWAQSGLPEHLHWVCSHLFDEQHFPKWFQIHLVISCGLTLVLCTVAKREEKSLTIPHGNLLCSPRVIRSPKLSSSDSSEESRQQLVGHFCLFTAPAVAKWRRANPTANGAGDYHIAVQAHVSRTRSKRQLEFTHVKSAFQPDPLPVSNCLPLKPKNGASALAIHSPVIQSALVEIDRLWKTKAEQWILITAPPGSGKDELVCTLAAGLLKTTKLPPPRAKQKWQSLSVAGLTLDQIQKRIEQVLVTKDAVCFVDEIHQAEREFYTWFLRVLEARHFVPHDNPASTEKVRLAYILFAASRNLEALRMLENSIPDFWTRIHRVIEFRHPLFVDKPKEVLKTYFHVFWWNSWHSAWRKVEKKTQEISWKKEALEFLNTSSRRLDESNVGAKLAEEFVKIIQCSHARIDSVRSIDTIAQYVFAEALALLRTGHITKDLLLEKLRKGPLLRVLIEVL